MFAQIRRFRKPVVFLVILCSCTLFVSLRLVQQLTSLGLKFTIERNVTSSSIIVKAISERRTQYNDIASEYGPEEVKRLIRNPDGRYTFYNLTQPEVKDTRGRTGVIQQALAQKSNGYFVEIYAGDGEKDSPTLGLEKDRGWTGLLVEPDIRQYQQLVYKRRKAALLNGCVQVKKNEQNGHQDEASMRNTNCFKFETILKSVNCKKIDLLALNIDGHEADFLTAFPFHSVTVDVLIVETSNDGHVNITPIVNMLAEKGLKIVHILRNNVVNKMDVVFKYSGIP